MEGIIRGIRRELIWGGEKEGNKEEELITVKIKHGKGWVRMVRVYVNGDLKRKLERMREWMEEKKKKGERTIFEGNFNARTGEEVGRTEGEEEEEKKGRRSRDKKINKEGRMLVNYIRERGRFILNGGIKEDEEGMWHIRGKGERQ